jgi:hypothetical protein
MYTPDFAVESRRTLVGSGYPADTLTSAIRQKTNLSQRVPERKPYASRKLTRGKS